ncbi:unnamed protein product [Blepharisma stoltei]|uniref:Uncharacterized protein n=1 Tax=Blepharisma stoltei TaxID=1481888 RepID=A0AAU9K0B4_9CILI|nr:unnamed protein product [Blepharisma stoltei]
MLVFLYNISFQKMFIKNQLYPLPWDEPKKKIRIKTSKYFHEKDQLWGSLEHTSPKMWKFYLKQNSPQNIAEPKRPNTASFIPQKSLSGDDLFQKIKEKETSLSSKRTCSTSQTPKSSYLANGKALTYKNPNSKVLHKNLQAFDQYNDLPSNKLKILLDPRIVKLDEKGVRSIQKKLEEEQKEEEKKENWIKENRYKTIATFLKKQQYSKDLQERSGLRYIRCGPEKCSPTITDRLAILSTPKSKKQIKPEDLLDARGLLTIDYEDAIREVSGFPRASKTSQLALRKSEIFPIPLSLQQTDRISSKTPKSKSTTRSFSVHSKKCALSQTEIKEGLKDINDFHKKFGELKGRVGFPQIDLEKYKSCNNP